MAFADVEMIPVQSSNVSAFGYDPNEMIMYVSFNSGSTYWYSGVDSSLYDSFMMSESKGRFLHQYLKGQYEYGVL